MSFVRTFTEPAAPLAGAYPGLRLRRRSLGLASCITTSELPLSKNVWQINVESRGLIFNAMADKSAVRRAAELTVAQGYTKFKLAAPSTTGGVDYLGTPPGIARTNVNIIGNTAYANTTYTPGVPIMSPHKEVSVTVIMFKDGDPGSGDALDAAQILKAE